MYEIFEAGHSIPVCKKSWHFRRINAAQNLRGDLEGNASRKRGLLWKEKDDDRWRWRRLGTAKSDLTVNVATKAKQKKGKGWP